MTEKCTSNYDGISRGALLRPLNSRILEPSYSRHPKLSSFRGSIPSLHVLLSTLRRRSYERLRMTRGRHSWLVL